MEHPTTVRRQLVKIGGGFAMGLDRPHYHEASRLAEVRLADILVRAAFFEGAPYTWILVSAGFGTRAEPPLLGRIDKKYGDLDISVGLDGIENRANTASAVADLLVRDCLTALFRAAEKYGRPVETIREELSHLPSRGNGDVNDEPLPRDELVLELRLSDDGFGDPSELGHLHKLADAIEEALGKGDVGSVEGTEVGAGTFSMFCVDGEPRAMLRVARRVLKKSEVRRGAVAIVIENGEETRIPLN